MQGLPPVRVAIGMEVGMRHCSVEADARTDLLGVIGTTVLSVIISFGIEVLVCMGIN